MANSVDPDQTARSSLIWICTVCSGLSVRKLRIITVPYMLLRCHTPYRMNISLMARVSFCRKCIMLNVWSFVMNWNPFIKWLKCKGFMTKWTNFLHAVKVSPSFNYNVFQIFHFAWSRELFYTLNKPCQEKPVFKDLWQGMTQTGLLCFRSLLESWNSGFTKYRYYTI